MKKILYLLLLVSIFFMCNNNNTTQSNTDTTISKKTEQQIKPKKDTINKINKIPCPDGYKRINVETGSYADYLRNLELKTTDNIVYLFNGEKKGNQSAQYAVLTIDVGNRDLQQCADAVMRMRGEYLYKNKQYKQIKFNFLGDGKPRYYTNYAKGNYSYKKFRKYMNYIFAYANTASLLREMTKVNTLNNMQIGDVFIQQGRPYGHAVTVMDLAENESTGDVIFLLSQSYMPAQDIHILKNPIDSELSPWYSINFEEELITPEWTFTKSDLKRF